VTNELLPAVQIVLTQPGETIDLQNAIVSDVTQHGTTLQVSLVYSKIKWTVDTNSTTATVDGKS
jgi:type VI protein secretion system component Hcp